MRPPLLEQAAVCETAERPMQLLYLGRMVVARVSSWSTTRKAEPVLIRSLLSTFVFRLLAERPGFGFKRGVRPRSRILHEQQQPERQCVPTSGVGSPVRVETPSTTGPRLTPVTREARSFSFAAVRTSFPSFLLSSDSARQRPLAELPYRSTGRIVKISVTAKC